MVYMTLYFIGGSLGSYIATECWYRFGWTGVCVFSELMMLIALAVYAYFSVSRKNIQLSFERILQSRLSTASQSQGATIVVVKKFILGFVIGLVFRRSGRSHSCLRGGAIGGTKNDVATGSTLVLHLEGDLPEQASLDVPIPYLQDQPPMTTAETWQLFERPPWTARIKALVLEPRGLPWGGPSWKSYGPMSWLSRNRASLCMPICAADGHEYYIATAADKIYMAPEDFLDVKGLRAELMYLKGTLDKLGVDMEFEHVGKYKDYSRHVHQDRPQPGNAGSDESDSGPVLRQPDQCDRGGPQEAAGCGSRVAGSGSVSGQAGRGCGPAGRADLSRRAACKR